MKNQTILSTLLLMAITIAGGSPMTGEEKQEMNLKLPMHDIAGTRRTEATALLDQLVARVETVNIQAASKGLRFEVTLINPGPEPVSLLLPAETTTVLLLNAEGWPIEVPSRTPSHLEDKRRDEPEKPLQTVLIRAGQTYTFPVIVTEVVPRSSDPQTLQSAPIAAGTYTVTVMTMLASPYRPDDERGPASRTIVSAKFTVHLNG